MDLNLDTRRTSDVEETSTRKTKVSDSGYSNSCSNSQSQRSSGSSKSRNSTSSRSSGYCGLPNHNLNDGSQPKRKDGKKKKSKTNLQEDQSSEPQPKLEAENNIQHSVESNALQIAAFSQTLICMDKMKYMDISPDYSSIQDQPESGATDLSLDISLADLTSKRDRILTEGEELNIAVSMSDGIVVFTSGLTTMLGYPKEMWLGRSLIDFIQPNHRTTLASEITSAIADSSTMHKNVASDDQKNSFFCCLRLYRGLKSLGFDMSGKRVNYLPCQLSITFKQLKQETNQLQKENKPSKEYLVITAVPVKSAYKYSDETRPSPKFLTKHSASCHISHVDPEVTQYFGYLPQDILGRSVLDFYHPEDLHFLKEVYEAVMKEQGHPFRSKPYRFKCQNGGYALLETELSSFVNPWTRKLEFVIGQHCVLRGPPNPDVVTPVEVHEPLKLSSEFLKETKIVQEEIKCLLNERVVRTSESAKQQVSKRCKDLAAFMESLMDEISKPPNLKIDVPTEEQSFSERDSVMFGEISPHHDYYDSKSSSATPPSYNQLNYNDNILRFFDSKPKTMVCEDFSLSGSNKNAPTEERILKTVENSTIAPSNSGGSGGSSGQSTESNGNSGATSDDSPKNKLQPPTLTKQILSRHNEDMEKRMVQKHREMRNKSDRDNKAKERLKPSLDKQEDQSWGQTNHGLKRSGSFTWDTEPHKALKTSYNASLATNPVAASTETTTAQLPTSSAGPVEPNLWPPFSVSLTPAQSSKQEYSGTQFASTAMPMYYIANQRPEGNLSYQNGYMTQQLQYMPSMMYHPFMFGTPPMVYSPMVYPPGPIYTQAGEAPQQTWPSNQVHVTESGSIPSSSTQQTTSTYKEESFSKQTYSEDLNSSSVPFEDSSYHSSFYSTLKTDKSESCSENEKADQQQKVPPIKKVAPWMEGITMTPECILNYQLPKKSLDEVLKADKIVLEKFVQPATVSQQLYQMYSDMEPEGIFNLSLEKDPLSSYESSDEDDFTKSAVEKCNKTKSLDYNATMALLFEEDAPLPSPSA